MMGGGCVEFVDFGGNQFDPVGLANELDVQVFQPAQEAQIWVNSYAYIHASNLCSVLPIPNG
jgi:hypothetical protein